MIERMNCRPHARPRVRTALLVAAALLPAASPTSAQPAQTIVIRGGWYFDANGGTRVRNPGIVIRAGKILRLAAPTAAELNGARVIEVSNEETVLPGLFDLHAHYNLNLFGTNRRDETIAYPAAFLANGVTTTFPAGEYNPEDMQVLRGRIERGEQPGPRLFNSGPYFGTARPDWNASITPQQIHAEVDAWAARGVKGFKAKGITSAHLQALIERAHWHGLTVTGHLDSGFRNSVNPKDAIRMGIDRIEHFMGGDALVPTRSAYASLVELDTASAAMKDIIRTYIDHRVYYDATLSTYGAHANPDEVYDYWFDEKSLLTPYVREQHAAKPRPRWSEQFRQIYIAKQRELLAFYNNGGRDLITLGTDHPSWGEWLSPFQAHRELHAMVKAGLPPAAALRAGTINAARAMNVADRLGSIEAGKFADLFIVNGNPLTDISATHRIRLVMKGGITYEPKALLENVKGKLGPADAEQARRW